MPGSCVKRCERNHSPAFSGPERDSARGTSATGEELAYDKFMYFVYILECDNKSLYTGITNDIERRFKQHRGKRGGNYTRSHFVEKIVHTEQFKTKSEALKREAEIKSWRREKS